MSHETDRIRTIHNIVHMEGDWQTRMAEWQDTVWEYDDIPVSLTATVFSAALSRFISGEISASALHDWADFMELREDIELQPDTDSTLTECFEHLANPVLYGTITPTTTAEYLTRLS